MPFPEYRSMPCDHYSQLELAIMRRFDLRLRWNSRGMVRIERVRPLDLRTRRGAEYMRFKDGMDRCRYMRLDRILSFDTIDRADSNRRRT